MLNRRQLLFHATLSFASVAFAPTTVSSALRVRRTKPSMTQHALLARDGQKLALSCWLPSAKPRALILALHSFGDFRLAFAELGPWLAKRGYAVFAYDQRGFGETGHFEMWAGLQAYVDDLMDAREALRSSNEFSFLPVFVLGESMGASVALVAAAQGLRCHGLLLAAPAVRKNIPRKIFWDALTHAGALLAPDLKVTIGRSDDDALSAYANERFAQDPRVWRTVSSEAYAGLVALTEEASRVATHVNAPSLVMASSHDYWIAQEAVAALVTDLGKKSHFIRLPDAPHLVIQDHQSLRAWTALQSFMDKRLKNHPSSFAL